MKTPTELRQFLAEPRNVVLIGHRNPDGDAIGSTHGLLRYLDTLGHTSTVVVPSRFPAFLTFLEGVVEKTLVFDEKEEETTKILEAAELIILMDFNSLDRIDRVGELVEKSTAPRVLIDHHLEPEAIADVMYSDSTASSTCELVYRLIEDMGDADVVNAYIAEPLMTGILTDTGGFSYAISPRLFRVVAKLFDTGLENERLQNAVFNSMTEKQLRILGHCLHNQLEVFPAYRAGLITLTKEDYEYYAIDRGDTEGVVNFILRMQGIDLAAFITEQPNIVKVSLRSKGNVNVQKMARENFKGGGHKNAAGGFNYGSLRSTVNRFKRAMRELASESQPEEE